MVRVAERIWLLVVIDMLVITLAGLIIEAKHANAVDHECETVLEFVRTPPHRGRHPPDDDLSVSIFPKDPPLPQQQGCPHVGILTNTIKTVKEEVAATLTPRAPHPREI